MDALFGYVYYRTEDLIWIRTSNQTTFEALKDDIWKSCEISISGQIDWLSASDAAKLRAEETKETPEERTIRQLREEIQMLRDELNKKDKMIKELTQQQTQMKQKASQPIQSAPTVLASQDVTQPSTEEKWSIVPTKKEKPKPKHKPKPPPPPKLPNTMKTPDGRDVHILPAPKDDGPKAWADDDGDMDFA